MALSVPENHSSSCFKSAAFACTESAVNDAASSTSVNQRVFADALGKAQSSPQHSPCTSETESGTARRSSELLILRCDKFTKRLMICVLAGHQVYNASIRIFRGANMTGPTLHEEFNRLEVRMHDLISLCAQLQLENQSLRDQQGTLVEERANLIKKNEMARSKVEQMIMRLKSMEASQ